MCFRFCVLCDLLSDWWFIISTFSPSTARNLNNNIFYWILVSGPQWSDPAVEGGRVSSCLVSEFQRWTHNTAGGTQGQGEGHQNYFRQLQWDLGQVVEWRIIEFVKLSSMLQSCVLQSLWDWFVRRQDPVVDSWRIFSEVVAQTHDRHLLRSQLFLSSGNTEQQCSGNISQVSTKLLNTSIFTNLTTNFKLLHHNHKTSQKRKKRNFSILFSICLSNILSWKTSAD